jgi:hypothetical protein
MTATVKKGLRFTDTLLDAFNLAYASAKHPNLSAFPQGVSSSNAFNATPFVVSVEQFTIDFDRSCRRLELWKSFSKIIKQLEEFGFSPQFALFGGSYLDTKNDSPKDLDGVVFYTRDSSLSPNLKALSTLQAEAHELNLDIRLVPLDMHPAILAKTTGFFSILYSQNRKGGMTRPCVIVTFAN